MPSIPSAWPVALGFASSGLSLRTPVNMSISLHSLGRFSEFVNKKSVYPTKSHEN